MPEYLFFKFCDLETLNSELEKHTLPSKIYSGHHVNNMDGQVYT